MESMIFKVSEQINSRGFLEYIEIVRNGGMGGMKQKNGLLLCLLGLLTACNEASVDFSELVVRDGKQYLKFSNEPYSGNTTGAVVGTLKDGLWHGERLQYSPDTGNLISTSNYVNGRSHGTSLLYREDGALFKKWEYEAGSWVAEVGYSGGFVAYENQWQDGRLHGLSKQYHPFSETLWFVREFKEGKPVSDIVRTTGNGLTVGDSNVIMGLELPLKENYAHGKVVILDNPECFAEYENGVSKKVSASNAGFEKRLDCYRLIKKSLPVRFRKD